MQLVRAFTDNGACIVGILVRAEEIEKVLINLKAYEKGLPQKKAKKDTEVVSPEPLKKKARVIP